MSPVVGRSADSRVSQDYWVYSRWECSGSVSSPCKLKCPSYYQNAPSDLSNPCLPSLLLFVIYFPRATSPTDPVSTVSTTSRTPTYRTALVVAGICLFHAFVTIIISTAFEVRRPAAVPAWANFLGVLSAVLASIQYFPQIYTTFRLRCVGSLSIPMMCIQTPGSLVWAGSLAVRKGWSGWSIWGVLVVTACLQGTLLTMAIYFEYFGPNRKRQAGHYADQNGTIDGSAGEGENLQPEPAREERPTTEETPLLQSQ